MGKDLKGRELGKGLYQRKDGRYEARTKINGSDVSIYGFNLRELKKEFQDLWECGFNMTLGSAWTGVARACLFPDREVNGVYVDLFEGTGLKLLAKAGLRDNPSEILAIKDSPRLAGYHIRDQPCTCKGQLGSGSLLLRVLRHCCSTGACCRSIFCLCRLCYGHGRTSRPFPEGL